MLTPHIILKMKTISLTLVASSILFCFLVFPLSASATDYYVKTPANGGSDANSGLDWGSAKATIGAAMALVNGDDNIYVAAGTYNEKVTFPGYNNIALRGGYPAAGGATQDPAANITIIDGTGISSAAPMVYVPLIQTPGTSGYFGIVVEGFTIRNGTHTGNGCAGIESYSVGITIRRNIIENNSTTGASGYAGGIHIFCPLNDTAKVTIEQNIVRNNSAAATGGINLEGAAANTRKYTAYLVNNLIVGNHSTATDPSWNRGVGGVEIMYPARASIVNCTIADNTAAHPTNPIGGVSISGYSSTEKGIAAIANSIIGGASGKDILADANGTFWIAYSSVKDATISGDHVIHTSPGFVGLSDYHLTDTSPCRNAGGTAGTVLTGDIKMAVSPFLNYLPDIGYKLPPQNYSDAQVTLSWGDGVHNLTAQWQYYTTSGSAIYGKFFGTNNVNCNADVSSGQPLGENIPISVDASTYTYQSSYGTAKDDYPWQARETVFWKGLNGYYGAWKINDISATLPPLVTNPIGRLKGTWYFQTNGSSYFDTGIRTQDLEGKTRPAQTAYDMGAYEYYPPNQTPTDIALSGVSVAENQPVGTSVGTLSTTDPDAGNTFTYTLVAGTGSTDNASFTISGSTLLTAAIFNYEAKNSYSIRVRSTDQGGLWMEEAFTITVTNVIEQAPTDIALSGVSVAEGQPGGTPVGTLSTADPDVGDAFIYGLVAGTGDTDNASFTISGSMLQTVAPFNYQTKSSYSIRVRSTDQDGLFTEKAFTIAVTKIGDINSDGKIDLTDFILVLQILSNQGSLPSIGISGDINGDGKIGIEEAIYILQKVTGIR